MATDILTSERAHPALDTAAFRPHDPSWADRFVRWLLALPGPEWLAWSAFAAVALAWTTSVGWLSGLVPVGQVTFLQSSYAFFLVFPFLVLRILGRAASRAMRAFAPALDMPPQEIDRLEYELVTVPARPAFILLIVGPMVDLANWVLDPVGAGVAGSAIGLVNRAIGEAVVVAAWFVVIFQVLRQLRFVTRLHALAVNVDLFRPAPLYAFSHLTVRVGIAFVIVAGASLLTSTPEQLRQPFNLGFLGVIVVIGIAAFALPLVGLHGRLVAERVVLEAAVSDRVKQTIARLHASVDSGDMSSADAIQKTLASLSQERDMLHRLRTWPWEPGVFRAFASAIALPVGLWLLTRLLERIV